METLERSAELCLLPLKELELAERAHENPQAGHLTRSRTDSVCLVPARALGLGLGLALALDGRPPSS